MIARPREMLRRRAQIGLSTVGHRHQEKASSGQDAPGLWVCDSDSGGEDEGGQQPQDEPEPPPQPQPQRTQPPQPQTLIPCTQDESGLNAYVLPLPRRLFGATADNSLAVSSDVVALVATPGRGFPSHDVTPPSSLASTLVQPVGLAPSMLPNLAVSTPAPPCESRGTGSGPLRSDVVDSGADSEDCPWEEPPLVVAPLPSQGGTTNTVQQRRLGAASTSARLSARAPTLQREAAKARSRPGVVKVAAPKPHAASPAPTPGGDSNLHRLPAVPGKRPSVGPSASGQVEQRAAHGADSTTRPTAEADSRAQDGARSGRPAPPFGATLSPADLDALEEDFASQLAAIASAASAQPPPRPGADFVRSPDPLPPQFSPPARRAQPVKAEVVRQDPVAAAQARGRPASAALAASVAAPPAVVPTPATPARKPLRTAAAPAPGAEGSPAARASVSIAAARDRILQMHEQVKSLSACCDMLEAMADAVPTANASAPRSGGADAGGASRVAPAAHEAAMRAAEEHLAAFRAQVVTRATAGGMETSSEALQKMRAWVSGLAAESLQASPAAGLAVAAPVRRPSPPDEGAGPSGGLERGGCGGGGAAHDAATSAALRHWLGEALAEFGDGGGRVADGSKALTA